MEKPSANSIAFGTPVLVSERVEGSPLIVVQLWHVQPLVCASLQRREMRSSLRLNLSRDVRGDWPRKQFLVGPELLGNFHVECVGAAEGNLDLV
jgi:hypothetical protein